MTTDRSPASHRPNTPAGELELGLQDNDLTPAAWDVALLADTDSGALRKVSLTV